MKTILIVEDSEACASTLEIALSSIPGFQVVSVPSVEEAHRILAHGEVGAVVTDLHLPGVSGLELIGWIRSDPRLAALPVVVISGDPAPDTPVRALAVGASAYFPKPYSPAVVRAKLEDLLHAR